MKPSAPIKSAIQAAASSPLVPAAAEPKREPITWSPAADEVEIRARVCGTFEPRNIAARQLQAESSAWLEELETAAAEEAEKIRQVMAAAEQQKREATAELKRLAEALHELRDASRLRAELLAEKAALEKQLAEAKATLADPKCIELPAEALLKLQLQSQHLPSKIGEVDAKITTASAAVAGWAAKIPNLDREKFMAHLRAVAKGRGYYNEDPRLLTLMNRGWFTF